MDRENTTRREAVNARPAASEFSSAEVPGVKRMGDESAAIMGTEGRGPRPARGG
jgi:hypothetical protein